MTSTRTGSVTIDARAGVLNITDIVRVPIKTAWAVLQPPAHPLLAGG